MTLKELPFEFQQAIPVIEAIEKAGFEAYFVGGSVRDMFLGKAIHDVDIATSAFPEEIKQIFPKTIDVGIEHGTVLVLHKDEQYEITTFRTESSYQDYRRPDKVNFVRSLEEDLKRRDFTMNALAMDKNGNVIDLFDGVKAIETKQIIAVGSPDERFNEDALRMLRALRFSSQLNFEIEHATLNAIETNHKLLSYISVERICVEWEKLLLGDFRNKGLASFIKTNSYQCCPDLDEKKGLLEELLLIDEEKIFKNTTVAWLIVCYCLKIKSAKSFLKKWKCSNKLIDEVSKSLDQLRQRDLNGWKTMDLYKSGSLTIKNVEEARFILNKPSNEQQLMKQYEALPIKSKNDLNINGNSLLKILERAPGPWLGKLLNELEEKVVLKDIPNNPIDLSEAAKKWIG